MTERLYYTNARLVEFKARVVAVEGKTVRLDRTAFYPTSGGQQFDTGVLGGVRVVDVVDSDAGIAHVLDAAPTHAPGAEIAGSVDWTRRFDHMQQHTGQHLLSALFEEMCGARTVSVHFGDVSATLDVDAESLPRDKAARVEARANALVTENRPVSVTFEDAATAQGLRKESNRGGELRVVSIEGIDRSACGGTHVSTTGEIGAVLIRKLEKYKKCTRIEFLCGGRATARARADYDALVTMAGGMSAGIDELPALVASQHEALRTLEAEKKKLTEGLAAFRARELHAAAAAEPSGLRRIVHKAPGVDELRALAHAIAELSHALFVGSCDSPLTVIVAASPDSGVNAGEALKAALAANGGRGGGNPKLAQGSAPTAAAVAAVVGALSRPS